MICRKKRGEDGVPLHKDSRYVEYPLSKTVKALVHVNVLPFVNAQPWSDFFNMLILIWIKDSHNKTGVKIEYCYIVFNAVNNPVLAWKVDAI